MLRTDIEHIARENTSRRWCEEYGQFGTLFREAGFATICYCMREILTNLLHTRILNLYGYNK